MELKLQKRLAADVMGCSEKRVLLDPDRLSDIKEAITKLDIRSLISDKAIKKKPVKGISRVRARKTALQKRKGKRKGAGSRKGKKTARISKKRIWIGKIRVQRAFLKELRDKDLISKADYHSLYSKSKGGFFRSKRHIKLYIEERRLVKKMKSKGSIPFKRKKQGKTNYKKRLRLLLSEKHRLVVRPFLNNISAQIIEYSSKGDKVVAAATARDIEKLGWKFSKGNIPAAYLTGLLAGKKALEKGVKEAILDVGLRNPTKGSRIFACLKGVIDAGIEIPHAEEELPSGEKISGKDIIDYANKIKENKEKYEKQFSKCLKQGLDPSGITNAFEEVKKKVKS